MTRESPAVRQTKSLFAACLVMIVGSLCVQHVPNSPQLAVNGTNQSRRQWGWNWLMFYSFIRWRVTALTLSLSLWQSRRMSSGLRVCNLPGPYSGVLSQKFKYFPFQLTECPLLLPRHAATHLWALKSCQSRIFMVGRAQTIKIFILIATTVPTFPSKRTN